MVKPATRKMTQTTEPLLRDEASGRFVAGTGGPGRKPGSRNKLTTQFVADLTATWAEHGQEALRRCATETPDAFVRVVAGLLPRDVSLTVGLDAASFSSAFETALLSLHGDEAPKLKPLRSKVIEHDRHR